MYTTTIEIRNKPQWKSEQQFINEHLYCDGLPYRQNDLTDLHHGMKYVGSEPEPVITVTFDDTVSVSWCGVRVECRALPTANRPVITKKDDFLW